MRTSFLSPSLRKLIDLRFFCPVLHSLRRYSGIVMGEGFEPSKQTVFPRWDSVKISVAIIYICKPTSKADVHSSFRWRIYAAFRQALQPLTATSQLPPVARIFTFEFALLLRERDSNPRPSDYEPDETPSSPPRCFRLIACLINKHECNC